MRTPAPILTALFALLAAARLPATDAGDWGLYQILSGSAQELVLEAPTDEGCVSVQPATSASSQKWRIQPREKPWVRISPESRPDQVLTVAGNGSKNGTAITLAPDQAADGQCWALLRQEDGTYVLQPRHTPSMGLDHFGGVRKPGAAVDLWSHAPGDRHLHWFIRPLAGSLMTPPPAPAASMAEPPPASLREGSITSLPFSGSQIFPGTTREVTVFVPAQYNASKPACVYVKTDGYNPREKTLLETLIATGEMPVTVGVFVRPGSLPAPMKGTADRRNRDFEYDAVTDDNVRFLDEELLPFVAEKLSLNLSRAGADRCIAGGSSGGIAAFTAAWHRPESFSRVYAASGSWVAFRGGHEFPTMVRKFEARPIRAFLTTATHDMENAAGDWFLLDQEMDKALAFSGYDYQFRTIDGRHVAGYMEHWREAMAFLWKDWPAPPKAGPSSPRARDILIPDENWKPVAEGFKSTRGPASSASGEVFFADTAANKILRLGLDGRVTPFVENADRPHCVSIGADGALYTVSEVSGKVMRYDSAGTGTVLLENTPAHSILAHPDGSLFLTTNDPAKARAGGSVLCLRDGKTQVADRGIHFATGMAFRPDRWLLSVAEGHSKWAYSYQVQPDGSLTHRERFFHLHVADSDDEAGTESLCYSLEGRQFLATRSGIQINADDGPTQVILTVPDRSRVTGVAIGGPDRDILYAFCMNRIWSRKIRQHALGAWSPWTPVTPTKL